MGSIRTENNFISKTFFWMFLGLFATGIVSFYTYSSGLVETLLFNGMFQVLAIVEVIVVLLFSFISKKLPASAVGILYFVYAIINGIGMSVIFAAFTIKSIAMVFFTSAFLFALFALIGYKTNIDLTRFGNVCLGVLLVGVFLSILNLILGNSLLDLILDWVLLIVFFGVTAYDLQKIKALENSGAIESDRLHIYCAMEIYLDFINIFIRLLSIFGKTNRN